MGVNRRGGGDVGRDDLADSGIESIRRDATGNVVFQEQLSVTGTTLTGITGTSTTQTTTARAFASSANVTFTTAGTPTAGTVALSRGGTAVTTAPATTTATLTTTNTFTSAPATWTIGASNVAGGTVNINTATVSREDTRG